MLGDLAMFYVLNRCRVGLFRFRELRRGDREVAMEPRSHL